MSHSLQIDKLVSHCVIPRDQSANDLLCERLDDIAKRHLPRALAEALEPLCPEEDDSIWMIRRIDVSFGADLAWGEPNLTRRWAAHFARSLITTMQSGRDGRSVFHYRSRAEYIAAFVTDLADGAAWSKWQYESFSGLRPLSSSAALRTLLVTETGTVLQALAMLTAGTLRRVIESLLSHDAGGAWSHLISTSARPGGDALRQALDVYESERFPLQSSGKREALQLLVRTLSGRASHEERIWREAVSAVEAVIALVRNTRSAAFTVLPQDEWSTAGNALQYWNGHPDLLERAMRVLANETTASARAESRTTLFGAVFLLLPLIEELPVEAWSNQPELLKFAIFARCCPQRVRGAAESDSFLRDLFGVSTESRVEDLAVAIIARDVWNWMRGTQHLAVDTQLDEEYLGDGEAVAVAAHSVLRSLARNLPGFGACSLPHLWANFLDFRASIDLLPEKILVRTTSPPLQVILRLAGLVSGSYTLPRIDARPFHLSPEA